MRSQFLLVYGILTAAILAVGSAAAADDSVNPDISIYGYHYWVAGVGALMVLIIAVGYAHNYGMANDLWSDSGRGRHSVYSGSDAGLHNNASPPVPLEPPVPASRHGLAAPAHPPHMALHPRAAAQPAPPQAPSAPSVVGPSRRSVPPMPLPPAPPSVTQTFTPSTTTDAVQDAHLRHSAPGRTSVPHASFSQTTDTCLIVDLPDGPSVSDSGSSHIYESVSCASRSPSSASYIDVIPPPSSSDGASSVGAGSSTAVTPLVAAASSAAAASSVAAASSAAAAPSGGASISGGAASSAVSSTSTAPIAAAALPAVSASDIQLASTGFSLHGSLPPSTAQSADIGQGSEGVSIASTARENNATHSACTSVVGPQQYVPVTSATPPSSSDSTVSCEYAGPTLSLDRELANFLPPVAAPRYHTAPIINLGPVTPIFFSTVAVPPWSSDVSEYREYAQVEQVSSPY